MADPVVLAAPILYDPVIAGYPFYVWLLTIFGSVAIFGGIAFYTEFWQPLEPVRDFRIAARKNIPQAIVFGANSKIWMESLEAVAGIFKSLTLPLMWILTAPVAGQLGKVNTVVVSDDWNILHNVDIDYSIVYAIHQWNEARKGAKDYDPDKSADDNRLIYDYKSFETYLMNGDLDSMFPQGVRLPPFRIVDLNEVRRYLPKWTASHFAGYINQEVAKRLEANDEKKGMKLVHYALIAGGILLACGGLAYLLFVSLKCPACG